MKSIPDTVKRTWGTRVPSSRANLGLGRLDLNRVGLDFRAKLTHTIHDGVLPK